MKKSKVLLVYTGGTIGMIKDSATGELKSLDLNYVNEQIPELARIPIDLTAISILQPIDSSDMSPEHWQEIADLVFKNYSSFDGFVILHGTDTMAYTASAISFMFQGLSKPILFTGSQLPIGTLRTDGKENLITAIEIAGTKDQNGQPIVSEVALYFQSSLFRGNRSSKISSHLFEAFSSPNYPLLGKAGVDIEIQKENLLNNRSGQLQFSSKLSTDVGLLKLFPGMDPSIYAALFQVKNNRALVIETFGSGNSFGSPVFHALITDYINSGGIVVNVTQCSSGSVIQGKYASSHFFESVGVISGNDLTTESAITKLMWLLANSQSIEEIKSGVSISLAGEID